MGARYTGYVGCAPQRFLTTMLHYSSLFQLGVFGLKVRRQSKQLQGLDYVYTVDGKLKAMNNPVNRVGRF